MASSHSDNSGHRATVGHLLALPTRSPTCPTKPTPTSNPGSSEPLSGDGSTLKTIGSPSPPVQSYTSASMYAFPFTYDVSDVTPEQYAAVMAVFYAEMAIFNLKLRQFSLWPKLTVENASQPITAAHQDKFFKLQKKVLASSLAGAEKKLEAKLIEAHELGCNLTKKRFYGKEDGRF